LVSPFHAALGTPLLDIGGQHWRIGDAAEGTVITGNPGSGKSSASGRAIAMAFLKAGFGGMVCCAKVGEAATWKEYAAAAGRSDDLVIIDADAKQRFNILDYAANTLGGRGFERNLLTMMERMSEATRVASNKGGGGDDENKYFADNCLKWLSHAFPLLRLVEGSLRLADVERFIATTPKSVEECRTKEWQRSYCASIHERAEKMSQLPGEEGEYAWQVVNDHGGFFLGEAAQLDNRPRSSIESTITNLIYPFLTGKLAELFCTDTTITPDECRDGKIIILDLPVLKYTATGAVSQTLFKYLFGVAMQTKEATATTRPCFIFADECQFFLNSDDATLLSTARSSKTAIVYLTQDISTFYATVGGANAEHTANSILGKFGTRIFHATTSSETAQAAAEMIGKVQKFHVSKTQNTGRSTGGGVNHHDKGGGFSGQGGTNASQGESLNGYLDYEVPPDYFATKLRMGGKKNHYKVDAILVRNGSKWKQTGRHWVKAEFSQK
jgi:hypothetical protein